MKWKNYSATEFAGDVDWTALGSTVIKGCPKNCNGTFYDIDDGRIFIGTFVNEGWRSVKDKIIVDKNKFEIINAEDEQDPNKKK